MFHATCLPFIGSEYQREKGIEKGITPFLPSHAPHSLLLLLLLHVEPPLGECAVGSPPPLLFPFLLDPGVQLGDGADAPDGVLDSLWAPGERSNGKTLLVLAWSSSLTSLPRPSDLNHCPFQHLHHQQ